jgi:acyl-CoA synthetase (AMP-forming)/AMP-acid ligase II
VFITGRKKDLIVKGGTNISPRLVEEVLLEHPSVEQAAVLGMPHPFYGEEVAAVLKLRPGSSLETERSNLLKHCQAELSAPAVPAKWIEVAEFPTTTTGKIQKKELYARLIKDVGKIS